MLQWGGLIDTNLMRFLQILLFNIIGYLTGLKAQKEKEKKERFRQAAAQLEKMLKLTIEQSEKLKEMEKQLRLADRLAVVGELTASMAHELRNPLGSIRGTVEILKEQLPENQKLSEFFGILVKETERLNSVVENYLSFSRRKPPQHKQFDLNEVIRNVVLLFTSRARKEGINLNLDLPDDPLYLKANPDELRQILINLILNAIQAMNRSGEIRIEVKKSENGYANDSQSSIEIIIEDQEVGIPQLDLENIFKPFYTTKDHGTGLGLSIVKIIVYKYHWIIHVDSQEGKGIKFYSG